MEWTILQDVVPLAESGAHLMIMPNSHRISLATVDDQSELAAATNATISGLRKHFSEPIFFFEHGPGFIEGEQIACGGCHMDHAHGHVLLLPAGTQLKPIQERAEQILYQSGWDDIPNKRVESTTVFTGNDKVAGLEPYIHMGLMTDDEAHAITYIQKFKNHAVESQLLRHVVSEVIYKHPESSYWHWRDVAEGLADHARLNQIQKEVIIFRSRTGY